MNMHELATKLSEIISRNLASVVDPLIKEKKDWVAIESKINIWFEQRNILKWCTDYAKSLSDKGVFFYDQYANLVEKEKVGELLEEVEFVQGTKADIIDRYGKIVPKTIVLKKCGAGTSPYVKLYSDGRVVETGCSPDPDGHDDLT